MFKKQEGAKIKLILAGGVLAIILVIVVAVIMASIEKANLVKANPELGRAMNYEEFTDKDEDVEGTENVKFSAFFLRDINQDGYAEKIKGTCKEIGQEDTLYMEINVETAGMLKNAKIEVQGNNFYLQTSLPKDNELKDNYIGNNIKVIEFNDLNNGTQKLLTGIVRSGDYSYASSKADAIGNNINNLSRPDNKVILTGTYVNEENQEIQIRKEVNLETDWYGETRASISTTNQSKNLEDVIDEENGTINLDFTVYTNETANQLILSKNYVEGEIPELNGYAPTSAEYTGSTGNFNYNAETRTFTIERIAEVDDQGNVTTRLSRSNSYGIKVVYPIEAYQTLGTETIQLKIPVKTYYEGYNNPNEEFTNPYKSNTASSTIVVNYENPKGTVSRFDVTVGKRVYDPTTRYIVSKIKPLNIYNGISDEEKDDTYTVLWQAYIGTGENLPGLVMKETATGNVQVTDQFIKTNAEEESTDDVASNVGVYFSGADKILGEDGWIKVYNEETGDLLVTFTKDDWNKYSSSNPYKYELPVKHVRIETSGIVEDESYLYVYNIKEIDDNKITEKYERAQFDELQYIKSTLVGYVGETYVNTDTHQANYEAPISVANIRISKNTISTQATEKNEIITIEAEGNTNYNEVEWKNGIFLVKLPEEIIDAQINNVEISNASVNIESYELIEQNNCKYIKIVTKNDSPATYEITIDVDLSPDPRKATSTRNIELYASNEGGENYYYKAQDIYDVNNNLNTEEQVNYRTTSISMISPNSLLTNQVASDYDDKGSEVISPQIADIKPIYAVVDQEQEVQTVKIGVQLKNNYASTTSEIQILGKIPFEGNTYVINGADLGSTFTSKMTNAGIELPEELKEIATVYYSENENPDRDLSKSENGWKTAGEVENWDNIKTYLIDLGNYVMPTGKEFVFNYVVEIPNGLAFNEVAYSHHAIYFCLDTDEGKYRTETEPNKLGLRIAEKYNLELTKYQKGKDKLVAGATYRITDEETGESKTGVTNAEGKLAISNLYAEKAYIIQEIKTPDDYELNSNIIRFIGHVDEEGNLSIERTEGFIKGDMTVTKVDGEEYKVNVEVEDEVKASIKITKKEEGTETLLKGVRFKLTGYGLSENGKSVTTNANGEATLKGLSVNQEYTLEEIKAEGYYLVSPIKFKVVNNDGNYSIEVLEGGNIEQNTIEDNGIPSINVTLENDKIPTYDLEVIKIKRTTESTVSDDELVAKANADLAQTDIEYLQGAKFKLYKGTEELGEYITDSEGKLTITGLYQYESDKSIDQTYTLKEVLAPVGYAKVKDIKFKAQSEEGTLTLKEINEDGEESDSSRVTVEGNKIKLTVEDSPSFKLIKKDGETGEVLPNTKFAIYNVDEGEVEARNSKGEIIGTRETINGREYYTVTTDEKGELTLDLPEGLYKAVEVQANNEKYDISEATYYFGIGGSREGKRKVEVEMATSFGGSSDDYINSVVATSDGGYIAGGYFKSSTIQVGSYTLTNNSRSTSYSDGMVIKYDESGKVEWARSIGENGDEQIKSVIETSDGGYIAGGYFDSSSIQIGEDRFATNGGQDGIIIKYDESGEVEWARRIGGSSTDYIYSVTESSDRGIIVAGTFQSSSIKVGDYILNVNVFYDGMIIKYSESGEVEWARSIGDTGYDHIYSVAATKDGGAIAVGNFGSNNIKVGEYTFNKSGTTDGIVIKYDKLGEVEWARSIGGSSDATTINSVALTNDGAYIVGGTFSSRSIQVGDYTLTNNSSSTSDNDGMIIKYDKLGEVEWAKNVGGSDDDYIESVASTSDGGITAVGSFKSREIQVGEYTLTNNSSSTIYSDGMIIKYDESGEVEWARSIGGNTDEKIESATETKDGDIIAVGTFESSKITLRDYTLQNNGEIDGMVLKYSEEEAISIETKKFITLGESDNDYIKSVINTSDGGYIVGGYYNSTELNINNEINILNNGKQDGYIIKYNSGKQVEWYKNIGGDQNDSVTNIIETTDGGFIAFGTLGSDEIILEEGFTLKDGDRFLIKYSSNGNIIWAQTLERIVSYSIIPTIDGGMVLGGHFSGRVNLNNGTSFYSSSTDGIVIKYDSLGKVEWGKQIRGSNVDEIKRITQISDGSIIVGGEFASKQIYLDNFVIENVNYAHGYSDAFLAKYKINGELEWTKQVAGSNSDSINSIQPTNDGGMIIGASLDYAGIRLENGEYVSASTGIIIKADSDGNFKWAKKLNGNNNRLENIYNIIQTKDEGYILSGRFSSNINLGDDVKLNAPTYEGSSDTCQMIVKYDKEGKTIWAIPLSGMSINDIDITTNNTILVAGYSKQDTIYSEDEISIVNNGNYDGIILNVSEYTGVPEVQELTVENTRRQFKITTDVKEVDGIKGGNISGEDDNPYETVKYGESNTKEIIMTPDENYEVIGITVNGQEWQFVENADGTYTMPQFTNVTEDKNIEVTYALKDNKLIINKVDSKTQEPLLGATFKLDQIEERTEPENVIGEIVANGTEDTEVNTEEGEVTGAIGDLTNNGTYYFVQNDDGTLTPTNSKTYQTANDGSSGKQNTTANSYIPIDLTGLEGEYVVVVNAQVYSESPDYGYATITTSTSAPTYSNTNGRFMYISGTSTSVTTAKDYTSNALTGGNTYYLHLGYRKDSSVDTGADQVVINSIKVYKANVTTYNFIQNENGGYESNNQGVDSTTANSYIPIDLTEYTGKYNLIVNAQVSSESNNDYAYATVTTTTSAPSYSNTTGRIFRISGERESQDYTTVLQGGQMYYLHLGYYKNSSTSSGDDKFTVNSVEITLNDSELYHTEVTTNSKGQGIVQLPFGKYQITEIEAPEGYELLETPIEIEFRADGNHEVTISNMEKAKVLVHHYLKTAEGEYTTEKVAEDELLEGKADETYTTSPHLDLEKYQLEEDAEGNYVIPVNATGTYKSGIQEVTYYYEEKDIPLIVHHYIEGTETPVLLKNGEQAKDEKYEGKENEEYTTNAISQEELNEKYELVEVPSNATGVYTPTETVVTYYYRVKDSAGVIVHHIDTETKEKIAPDVIIPVEGTGKYGDSYTTEVSEEVPANYEYVAKTDNWEGTMVDKLTEVTYEYKKVEPNIIDEQIEKTATQAIENPSAEIEYKIKYTTQVENYIGKAQITIVDELPYPIDTTKSELAGGTYNEANNTITWVEVVEGIDTYTQVESGKIEVNKTIKVVYKNVDDRNTEIENRVNGRLKLLTPEKTSEGVTTTAETVIKSVVNIPVSKVWEDDSDKLGKRPRRVVFKLTGSDGSEYTKELAKPGTQGSTTTQDSTNPNKWNDIFENLPKYDSDRNEIEYTLTEEEKTEGDLKYYDSVVTDKTVTNTNKYGKVTVHHYIMNTDGSLTTTRVPDAQGQDVQDVVIEGKEGDPYTTEEATNVSEKYELVEEKLPENAEGTIEKYNEEKPQEVIYYYRLKPAKVLINYLEKDEDTDDSNNVVLSGQEQIDGHVDDSYNTDTDHRKETIEKDGKKYTLVSDSGNKTGNMTLQDITVTYYYLQNTKATVRYVERNPETHEIVKDLEEPTVKEGLVGDEFVTNSKDFVGYKLVESPEKTTIEMTKEEQTLIYYYEPVYTGLIENHIDDKTGKVLYTETHDVQVGEDYDIPSKEFEGYDLVESKLPENAKGTMGEELVTVNYYYIKKAVLEVNYIDKLTGEPLTEQIVDETKHEGDEYTTEQKTFENYDLIEVPENSTGTMVVETDEEGNITNNRTVVTYYYSKKSAGVEEHHIDIRTGEELEEPTLHEGHVGDEYDIKAKEFLSYVVATTDKDGNNVLPENATGTMTEEKIIVNYYYNQPAKVIVHYVEKATGKEIEEINPETGELQNSQIVIEGFNQDEYETTAKEFEYYTLIESPEEPNGTMKVEIVKDEEGNDIVNNTIELYYYYQAKPFNIGVEKEITGIIVNGERREPTNGKLEKVEIYRKSTESTSVQVEYKIKVMNTGEVNGNATIEENIPEGMSLANNDGTWEEQAGVLRKIIAEINPGETKEYTVVLDWNTAEINMGEKDNIVSIVDTQNIPGFTDNNEKDNTSNANVIISVETGELPIGLILALVALVGLETVTLRYAVVLTKRQKKK